MKSTKKLPRIGTKAFRILVARDVLKQLDLKKYIARNMTYFSPLENGVSVGYSEYVKFVDFFSSNQAKCEVCAMGAAMCSITNLTNGASVYDVYYFACFRSGKLIDVFGEEQLALMESAFECVPMNSAFPGNRAKAIAFGKRFADPDERLRAIMKNIIKNRGDFKP